MTYSQETEVQLRKIFKGFNQFMLALWRLGLGGFGNPTRLGGAIMVIKHKGWKSGLTRYAPVNFAEIDGEIYCTAGFGEKTHWYKNLLEDPNVELWLPHGRWAGIAEDVTSSENRIEIMRAVLVASGFAGLVAFRSIGAAVTRRGSAMLVRIISEEQNEQGRLSPDKPQRH